MNNANVYNGYLTGIERYLAIEDAKLDNAFSRIDTMWEMVNLEYEQNIRDAELKVFSESGTYEDLLYLYQEAENEANQKKGGILSKLCDFISSIFDTIGNWFGKLFGNGDPPPPPDGEQPESLVKSVNGFMQVKEIIGSILNTIVTVLTFGLNKKLGNVGGGAAALGAGLLVWTVVQKIGLDKVFSKEECDQMNDGQAKSSSFLQRFKDWYQNNKSYQRTGKDMVDLSKNAKSTFDSLRALWKKADEGVKNAEKGDNNNNNSQRPASTSEEVVTNSTNDTIDLSSSNSTYITEKAKKKGKSSTPPATNNQPAQQPATNNQPAQQPAPGDSAPAENGEQSKEKNKVLESIKLVLTLIKDVFLAPFQFIVGKLMIIFKIGDPSEYEGTNDNNQGDQNNQNNTQDSRVAEAEIDDTLNKNLAMSITQLKEIYDAGSKSDATEIQKSRAEKINKEYINSDTLNNLMVAFNNVKSNNEQSKYISLDFKKDNKGHVYDSRRLTYDDLCNRKLTPAAIYALTTNPQTIEAIKQGADDLRVDLTNSNCSHADFGFESVNFIDFDTNEVFAESELLNEIDDIIDLFNSL